MEVVSSTYTNKDGRDFIKPGITRAADKWHGHLLGKYKFYWSQVWDPIRSRKEVVFMWSIWYKAIAVNE